MTWGTRSRRAIALAAVALSAMLAFATRSEGQEPPAICQGAPATLVGTPGDDMLFGTLGDDVIVAQAGNDRIDGLAGNDRICAGDGDDSVGAGAGDDVIDLGAGANAVEAGSGNDVIDGSAGTLDLATYFFAPGVRANLGEGTATGDGSDVLRGIEALAGSAFNDVLIGDAGANFFIPLTGDDEVRGGDGYDLVIFFSAVNADFGRRRATGEGTDLIDVEGGSASGVNASVLIGDARDNFLQGSEANDVLRGGGGDDSLAGLEGNDRLFGEAGSDTLRGGPGNDLLNGGAGTRDEASYVRAAAGVRVDLAAGRSTGEGTDVIRQIDVVTGSQFDDVIRGDAGENALYGNGGNDTLAGRGGADFLEGGSGRDALSGGTGPRARRGRGAVDYCVGGERRAGCEQSEAAREEEEAAPVMVTPPRAAGASTTRPRRVADCRSVFCAFELARVPLGAARAAATLADTIHYKYDPQCIPGTRGATTTVAPPSDVGLVQPPNRVQTVVWQGKLYRGGTVVYETPIARAPIAGPSFPHVGTPFWTTSTGRAFAKRLSHRITQPGRYRWEGSLTWIEAQRPVVAFLRPMVVNPGRRPAPHCVVSR